MHDLDLVDPINAANAIINGNTCKVDLAEVKINHVTKYAINITIFENLSFEFCLFSCCRKSKTPRTVRSESTSKNEKVEVQKSTSELLTRVRSSTDVFSLIFKSACMK